MNEQIGGEMGAGFLILVGGGMLILSLAAFAFWLWMLIDCITNEPAEGNQKVLWIVLIVVLGVIGAFAYYIARRGDRIRQYGK